ncbi:TPA: helix-turn-helix domain-containing protein [Enterococcus faecalis]|uniref:helix-turn-helix domain-containing protein n=1 Tax=Enterococcus faecalis TaxID=1351 RepID=UPI001CAF2413|nr:helix-turn-helix domain-containing protein [Enterococcus faecalis]HBI3767423.1 helix-turn-helix domain-containing protein [Enterococcus faecalis]
MSDEYINYTSIFNNFSKNMRNKRLELNMSQKKLAQIVGVSAKTIQNYENRNTVPNSVTMEAIATALGLSLEKIIDDDENTKRKLQIAKYLDYMEKNGVYYRHLEGLDIAGLIYDKVDFKKRVADGIEDEKLDIILKGRLDITREEKIELIELIFDSKIKSELKRAETQIEKRFDEYATGFRAIRANDMSILEKNNYFASDEDDDDFL